MILNALAMLICVGGAVMLVPAAYSLLKAPEEAWIFWAPGVVALAVGAALYYPTRRRPRNYVSRQSLFLMVVACWGGVVLVGTLPFVLSGLMGPGDAFFINKAGFTTKEEVNLTSEELPPALLIWRSLSQWIGGIGIIVLFVPSRRRPGSALPSSIRPRRRRRCRSALPRALGTPSRCWPSYTEALRWGAYSSCTWPGWERSTPSTTPSPPSRPAGSLPTPTPWQPSTPGP